MESAITSPEEIEQDLENVEGGSLPQKREKFADYCLQFLENGWKFTGILNFIIIDFNLYIIEEEIHLKSPISPAILKRFDFIDETIAFQQEIFGI